MSYAILSLVSFVQVFALGLQSRNVNHGNYGWAAGTSFFIGLSQAAVWKRVAQPGAGSAEAIVYACSGAVAIVCAMFVHQRYLARATPTQPTNDIEEVPQL